MKSKKDTEKVDNDHYDEAMVLNDSDDNLAESKENKNQIIKSNSK